MQARPAERADEADVDPNAVATDEDHCQDQPDKSQPRCEVRRQQILDAAATCFARQGFHGASIAQISKLAGMSAGHMYHFFENKEAIIAALIERELNESLELMRQCENTEDVFQAIIERLDTGLSRRTDRDKAALEIEILAETARNPNVAAMVQKADLAKREQVQRLLRSARVGRGLTSEKPAATDVIMALFDGLASRAISNPDLDRAALLPLIRQIFRTVV